jgi:hypothetical protein
MAVSIDQYRALIAERHVQMYALKAGVVRQTPTGDEVIQKQHDAEDAMRRKGMVDEAFSLADEFIAGCRTRGLQPWERENL